jgi:nitroreductase
VPSLAIEGEMPAAARDLAALVVDRHSCRGFLARPVPRPTIEMILAIAQGAASWCNSQPWQVIITEGAATERFREALFAYASSGQGAEQGRMREQPDFAFPERYVGVYKERQRETGWALYSSVGIAHGDRAGSGRQMLENFRLFGAPHVMIVTTEADLGVYGAVDCGLYINTFLLAAHSLGVASAPQAALAAYSDFLHDHFTIPDNRRVVAGISFGYPDLDHPVNAFRTNREEPENAITWHTG